MRAKSNKPQIGTTTTITPDFDALIYGYTNKLFTAHVSDGTPTAVSTGLLRWKLNGRFVSGNLELDKSGEATYTTSHKLQENKKHELVAIYGGSGQYASSVGTKDIYVIDDLLTESNKLNPNVHNYDNQQDGLGSGAHGFVFRSKRGTEPVAVKVFTDQEKWEKEFKFLYLLAHDHVARLRGYGSDVVKNKQFYYLLLELGECSLRQFLDSKDKEIPWSDRISIALGIAEGLWYIHSGRDPIFHRDLKAANISLREDRSPFLIDFSLSKRFEGEEVKSSSFDEAKICQTNEHIHQALNSSKERGTRGYMAPEMASKRHGKTSLASDIYSLGVIFYEILTRDTPPLRGRPKIPTSNENPAVRDCSAEYLELMESCWKEKADRPKLEDVIRTLKMIKEDHQKLEILNFIDFPYTLRKLIIEYARFSSSLPSIDISSACEKMNIAVAKVDVDYIYIENWSYSPSLCISLDGKSRIKALPFKFQTKFFIDLKYIYVNAQGNILQRFDKTNLNLVYKTWHLPFDSSNHFCVDENDHFYEPQCNGIFSCHLDEQISQIEHFNKWHIYSSALACDESKLYVVSELCQIQILDKKTGIIIRSFYPKQKSKATLYSPPEIVYHNSLLYLNDKSCIRIFTTDGWLLQHIDFKSWGSMSAVGDKFYALNADRDRIFVWRTF